MLLSWHPCGQVMDLKRRGQRCMMRTRHGADPVEVVWHEAAPDAKWYEAPTVFRSRDWDEPGPWDGIGQQEPELCCGKRQFDWYNGASPAPYTGQQHCGSVEVARRGALPGDPEFMTDFRGVAPCCGIPMPDPFRFPIGLSFAGAYTPPSQDATIPLGMAFVAQLAPAASTAVTVNLGMAFAGEQLPRVTGGEIPLGLAFAGEQLPRVTGGEIPLGLAFVGKDYGPDHGVLPLGLAFAGEQLPRVTGGEIPLGLAFAGEQLPRVTGGEIPIGLAFVAELRDPPDGKCRPITGCAACQPEAPFEISFAVDGAIGQAASANGNYNIPVLNREACGWQGEQWALGLAGVEGAQLSWDFGIGCTEYWRPNGPMNCCGTTRFYRVPDTMHFCFSDEEWASLPAYVDVTGRCCGCQGSSCGSSIMPFTSCCEDAPLEVWATVIDEGGCEAIGGATGKLIRTPGTTEFVGIVFNPATNIGGLLRIACNIHGAYIPVLSCNNIGGVSPTFIGGRCKPFLLVYEGVESNVDLGLPGPGGCCVGRLNIIVTE